MFVWNCGIRLNSTSRERQYNKYSSRQYVMNSFKKFPPSRRFISRPDISNGSANFWRSRSIGAS